MQIEHTPEHTELVTQYIAAHRALCALEASHDVDVQRGDVLFDDAVHTYRLARAEGRAFSLSQKFTAAQWEELYRRRG